MESWKIIISAILKRLDKLETNVVLRFLTIPSNGYFVPKVLAADPSTPQLNECWINSTSNQLKWKSAGGVKAVTLS